MDSNQVVRALIRDRAKLLGYAWAILRDHHAADDVFQEVTVLAMERPGEIADEAHLARWARKAARLKCLEVLRRRSKRSLPLDGDVLDLLEAEWEDPASGEERVDHLRECVDKLSPRAREVLGMRYSLGLSGARVAELLQIKVESVYVALARIHKALGDCISRRAGPEVAHG